MDSTLLTETESPLIKRYIKVIRGLLPEVYKVVLFGSKVRGDVNEESDIDIAVFVDSTYDKGMLDKIINTGVELLLENDLIGEIFLNPVAIFKEDLSRNRDLVKTIEEEGVVLWEKEKRS